MARDEYVHHRLVMWALWRWRMKSGGGNYARVDLGQAVVDRSGAWDAPAVITNIDAEAEETERAVQSLQPELYRAVEADYCRGGKVEAKAKRCGCAVATFYARIEQAHRAISRWLSDQAELRRRERERVEALQRSAVRGGETESGHASAVVASAPHSFPL